MHARFGITADLYRHSAQPLEQVKLMRALVDQYAAALAAPRAAPAALIIIGLWAVPVGDHPIDPLKLAQSAAVNDSFRLPVKRVGALVVHNPEYLPLFCRASSLSARTALV